VVVCLELLTKEIYGLSTTNLCLADGLLSILACFSTVQHVERPSIRCEVGSADASLSVWKRLSLCRICRNLSLRISGFGSSHISRSPCWTGFPAANAAFVTKAPTTGEIVPSATCSQASKLALHRSSMSCGWCR